MISYTQLQIMLLCIAIGPLYAKDIEILSADPLSQVFHVQSHAILRDLQNICYLLWKDSMSIREYGFDMCPTTHLEWAGYKANSDTQYDLLT